jgi:K+-sensing histidine kinase KdpD
MSPNPKPNTALEAASLRRGWVKPVTVSLVLFALTTAAIWLLDAHLQQEHLVFLYVVPASLVAIRYGSVLSMGIVLAGSTVAAYLLYTPQGSLFMTSPLDVLELTLFGLLALFASQVVSGFVSDRALTQRHDLTFAAIMRARWPLLAARWGRSRPQ